MFRKSFLLIISIILIIFFVSSCNAEYNKYEKEYQILYDNTINLIDSNNVYKSITDNELKSNLDQLNILIEKIDQNASYNKNEELFILQARHNRLKEIIEKGLMWDSLGGLEKLTIQIGIDIIKPKE